MTKKNELQSNQVLITVLMSVFNTKEEYLHKSIQSILNQSFTDFEFLIFNDCSNVRTTAILRGYKDERIKLIENSINKGLTRNLNVGIGMARGKYLARMDADDISLPKRLETQYTYMEKHQDVDILGGKVLSDSEMYVCWRYYPQELRRVSLLFGNFGIFHPSAFLRTDFLRKNNLFYDEEYDKSQDYELWTRAFRIGKVAVCREPILYYRFHAGQISTDNNTKSRQKELDAQIRQKLFVELIPCLTDKESEQLLNLNTEILSADSLSDLFFRIVEENEKKEIYSTYFLKNELALRWFWILRGIIPRSCINDYKRGEWFRYIKTLQFGIYLLRSRLLRILCEPRRIRKPVEDKLS